MATISRDDTQSQAAPRAGAAAILAARYARALIALADKNGQGEAVAADMAALQGLLRDSAPLRRALADPRPSRAAMGGVMRELAQGLGPVTGNFLGLLAQNRRAGLLQAVIHAFMAEHKRRRGELTATVTAAAPLSDAQQSAIRDRLAAATGKKIDLDLREDAELLGGFTLRWGSQWIDASLRGRLAALTRYLKGAV